MIRLLKHLGLALAVLLGSMQFAFAVDVNTADAAALDSVKDIGPATASKIIEERNKNGPFKDWDDLVTRVKGVGPKNSDTMSAGGLTVNGKAKPNAPAAAKPAKEAKEAKDESKPAPSAKDTKDAAESKDAGSDKKEAKKKRKSKKDKEKAADAGTDTKPDAKAGAKTDDAGSDKKEAKKKRKSKKEKAADADAKTDGGTPSDTKPAK
jgi:competence protein ComEA